MPLLAASIESLLVFLVIILLSGLSNWLKHRQEHKEQAERQREAPLPPHAPEPDHAPPSPAPQPEKARDWEEELRRLFGGEPAPPPPAPRPVTEPPTPIAPPPPVVLAPPRTQRVPELEEAPEPAPVALPQGTHFPRTAEALDTTDGPEFILAPLKDSASAIERARQLRAAASARLHPIVAQTETHARATTAATVTHPASPEVLQLIAQLRHPRAARQAILASVVLAPPKAFDGPLAL